MLTPQLIRLEWAEDKRLEDRASLVFINRLMPVAPFERTEKDGWLVLRTRELTRKYKEGRGAFARDRLSLGMALFDREKVTWRARTMFPRVLPQRWVQVGSIVVSSLR